MRFALEALQANDGDCLLLHYSPAGARGAGAARPDRRRLAGRLQERAEAADRRPARPAAARPADGDGQPHRRSTTSPASSICSRSSSEQQTAGDEPFCRIRTLWFNSFEQVHGETHPSVAAASAAVPWRSADSRASTSRRRRWSPACRRANQLRQLATDLQVPFNEGAGAPLVMSLAAGAAHGSDRRRPDVHDSRAAQGAARSSRARLDQGEGGSPRGSGRADGRLPEQHRPQHVEHRGARRSRRGRAGVKADAADRGCARRRDSRRRSTSAGCSSSAGPLPLRSAEGAAPRQQPQHDAGLLRARDRRPLRDLRQRQTRHSASGRARLAFRGAARPGVRGVPHQQDRRRRSRRRCWTRFWRTRHTTNRCIVYRFRGEQDLSLTVDWAPDCHRALRPPDRSAGH